MTLTRLFPPGGAPLDLGASNADHELRELYRPPRRTWLRANLIASINGNAVGGDGTSETLSNRTDRAILRVIRSLAGVVLIGAGSVRTEGYFLPRDCDLAIVTTTGNLTGHRLRASAGRGRVLVICPPGAEATVRHTLGTVEALIIEIDAVDGRLDSQSIVGSLRSRGYETIVCEGGPRLAAQLISDGLVDEICLSTSPALTTTTVPLLGDYRLDERHARLTQLLIDESSSLYARWSLAAELTAD